METIITFFSNLFTRIKDWIEEKGKLFAFLIALLFVLIVCTVIVGISELSRKKNKTLPVTENSFSVNELVTPGNDSLTEDYYFSRPDELNWSNEEFDRWFIEPTPENITQLQDENKKISEKILGVAP